MSSAVKILVSALTVIVVGSGVLASVSLLNKEPENVVTSPTAREDVEEPLAEKPKESAQLTHEALQAICLKMFTQEDLSNIPEFKGWKMTDKTEADLLVFLPGELPNDSAGCIYGVNISVSNDGVYKNSISINILRAKSKDIYIYESVFNLDKPIFQNPQVYPGRISNRGFPEAYLDNKGQGFVLTGKLLEGSSGKDGLTMTNGLGKVLRVISSRIESGEINIEEIFPEGSFKTESYDCEEILTVDDLSSAMGEKVSKVGGGDSGFYSECSYSVGDGGDDEFLLLFWHRTHPLNPYTSYANIDLHNAIARAPQYLNIPEARSVELEDDKGVAVIENGTVVMLQSYYQNSKKPIAEDKMRSVILKIVSNLKRLK